MNIQFAVKGSTVYILEVNPRASRTVPFVAKATGRPIAKIAARIMAGERLTDFDLRPLPIPHVAVKEAVFPFARFPGVDILLGPEMKSTGEVMGIDADFGTAFAKSQLGAGVSLPLEGGAFLSVKDGDKAGLGDLATRLLELGFDLIATGGTAEFLKNKDLPVRRINKVYQGQPHCVDAMINGEIQIVINTTSGAQAIKDSYGIRRTALTRGVPHYTTMAGARAAIDAIAMLKRSTLAVTPLQAYFG